MLHHVIIGEGRPLLILHGVTLDHRYMVETLEPIFQETEGWQRVYVDMPGHGLSPPRDNINSQDDLLAAVVDFADEVLANRSFAIIGLSRGSYIARGIVHLWPERVTGAALIVPGGNPSADPARLPAHQTIEPDPSIRPELAHEEIWRFENFMVVHSRDILAKTRRVVTPAKEIFDAAQDARVCEAFDFSFHTKGDAPVFEKPSLIIAGRQDSMSGYLDAMDLVPQFPRATLAVLDAAGHGLVFERPDVFNALVRDWLVRLAAAAA